MVVMIVTYNLLLLGTVFIFLSNITIKILPLGLKGLVLSFSLFRVLFVVLFCLFLYWLFQEELEMFIWKSSAIKDFFISTCFGSKSTKWTTGLPTPEERNKDLNLGMASVAQEEQRNYAVRLKNGKCTEESVIPKSLVSSRTGGKEEGE